MRHARSQVAGATGALVAPWAMEAAASAAPASSRLRVWNMIFSPVRIVVCSRGRGRSSRTSRTRGRRAGPAALTSSRIHRQGAARAGARRARRGRKAHSQGWRGAGGGRWRRSGARRCRTRCARRTPDRPRTRASSRAHPVSALRPAQPAQPPTAHAMYSSSDTWQGTSKSAARRAAARSIGVGPHANTSTSVSAAASSAASQCRPSSVT